MVNCRGFTLVETLITTFVLVTGLAAVAGLFAYGAHTSLENRQRTAATILLSGKIEELRRSAELAPGEYSEYVSIGPDGGVVVSANGPSPYRRIWKVESGSPQRVTIVIHGWRPKRRSYTELARATALLGRRFQG